MMQAADFPMSSTFINWCFIERGAFFSLPLLFVTFVLLHIGGWLDRLWVIHCLFLTMGSNPLLSLCSLMLKLSHIRLVGGASY